MSGCPTTSFERPSPPPGDRGDGARARPPTRSHRGRLEHPRAARQQVCRLEVETNVVGAAIWVDGRKVTEGAASDFWAFVRPGPHEVRASLEGHEDDVQRVELPAGGSERIALPRPAARVVRADRPSWTAGLGAAGVYGALAPLPAFGFVGWIGRRWGGVYSVELDVRAAWSPYDIAGEPIRGISVAALPALCAHRSRFSLCAQAHLGGIIHQWSFPTAEGSAGVFRFGLGAKGVWRIPLSDSIGVRVSGDLVLLTDETAVDVGPRVLWTEHPLLAGLSVGGEVSF